jgi:hypothetical protein
MLVTATLIHSKARQTKAGGPDRASQGGLTARGFFCKNFGSGIWGGGGDP